MFSEVVWLIHLKNNSKNKILKTKKHAFMQPEFSQRERLVERAIMGCSYKLLAEHDWSNCMTSGQKTMNQIQSSEKTSDKIHENKNNLTY